MTQKTEYDEPDTEGFFGRFGGSFDTGDFRLAHFERRHERRDSRLGIAKQHPDAVIASVGGGSNAIGIFHPYIEQETVRLIGVEAAGLGLPRGRTGARLAA